MSEEKDMTELELDADNASAELSALTKEGAERLVPADRDWDAIEVKLLARIDAEIAADEPSEELEAITRESKTHLVPVQADWAKMEKKLLRRIDARRTPLVMPVRWNGIAAVGAIAAAAALVIWAGRGQQQTWSEDIHAAHTAGVLGAHEGSIRIGGNPAANGQAALVGDRIEVSTGGHAVFEQPGQVTWGLEAQSRVRVTRTEGGLVLALEQGATEAQVVPVPSGEAFAVDISDSSGNVARVAVHGTHLRVARAGDRVSVDLTEGVVTVGRAPRSGSTYGTLVTAPAHVEFDIVDITAVRVDHTPTSVRPAAALAYGGPTLDKPVVANNAPPPVLMGGVDVLGSRPEPRVAPQMNRPVDTPAPVVIVPNATETIEQAVKTCFAQGASQFPAGAPEIHMSVSTDLSVPIDDQGAVHTFQFSTPLSNSEQQCVGNTVWPGRFPQAAGQTLTIHFDLSR